MFDKVWHKSNTVVVLKKRILNGICNFTNRMIIMSELVLHLHIGIEPALCVNGSE